MSDEQQQEQQQNETMVEVEKKENKTISNLLYVLVIISLIFSIVSSTLSIIGFFGTKDEPAQPARAQRTTDRKKVVISTQYDKGQSLKKAYKTHKPVVVFFYTDWCGFCQRFVPTFHKVVTDREIKNKFAVAYVNCENSENKEYMRDFGVRGFPTVYVISKDGSRTHLENSTFFNDDSVKIIKENMLKAIED